MFGDLLFLVKANEYTALESIIFSGVCKNSTFFRVMCSVLCCAVLISHFSRVWPFTMLCTVALQVPLSVGFSRQEYWSGLLCPPPGDLPHPGMEPRSLMSPALAGRFFTIRATWEAQGNGQYLHYYESIVSLMSQIVYWFFFKLHYFLGFVTSLFFPFCLDPCQTLHH